MKLYYSPGACSLASHILLREIGAAFALERVDTGAHRTEGGADYYAINPKGQVPLLELADGQRLSEGPIIGQYLSELAAADALLPRAGLARYRVLEWQNYVATELHKSFTPLFRNDLDEAAKVPLRAGLRRRFEWLESRLDGDYLTGAAFTVADAYLFAVARWAPHVALELGDLPRLQAYLRRVAQRPAVIASLRAEGLLAA
ncbi:glutathione transferase GstA [Lysobacter firmicutimachus]|uniref:Glutathione transferase GstA n=1 Tax=Lysobacter firmicutimachus TaxID=1792846 RepID=A0AAU8MY82_9GAMM